MHSDTRLFHRGDPDFPTTAILQQRLVAAGRVVGEGPLAPLAAAGKVALPSPIRQGLRPAPTPNGRSPATLAPAQMAPPASSIPLGETDGGTLHLDLRRLLAGRCLIQGSSGAGKSATLRHLVEQAQDFLTIIIIDPEGEFGNLAAHVGAATLRAADIAGDGLTAAALRARQHRLPLHLDLTDLAPDDRISKAAAFNAGLLAAPREHWAHTVLVVIDEAHLLAPHLAASARDAETRRLGVATLTELCARGRKRGICPVIATQRLAKLATSVVSELHNVLLGLNVFDRDVARAGDLLGFGAEKASALRTLEPGAFYALGPALCATPQIVRITPSITSHTGATPDLVASANLSIADAQRLLELDALRETGQPGPQPSSGRGSVRALDSFLLDDNAAAAARVVTALRAISPNATTAAELQQHLALEASSIDAALDLLTAAGAIDTVPRGAARIARLSARLRLRAFDTPVVRLA